MIKKNLDGIIILTLLSIVLIILCVLVCNRLTNDDAVDVDEYACVILPKSEYAGQDYVDKLYFVGDSTTYHFFKCGIDRTHLLVPDSFTLKLDSSVCDVLVANTDMTIPEAIAEYRAEFVIITLGVNGADNFTEKEFKTYYNKLINAIKKLSPDTKIILQSAFPVEEWYSNTDNGISNAGIDRLNAWAKQIAYDQGIHYLDTQTVLKNDNGAMIESFAEGDGVHMNAEGYEVILDYIRSHSYK